MSINEYDSIANDVFVEQKQPDIKPVNQNASDNEYDEIANNAYQPNRNNLEQSGFVAARKDPNRAAEAKKLADELQMPIEVIERNLEKVKQEKEKQKPFDYQKVLDGSETLARWMTDPYNATMAKDDVDNLVRISPSMARIKNSNEKKGDYIGDLGSAVSTGYDNLSVSSLHLGVAYGLISPEDAADSIAQKNKKIQERQLKLPEYAKEFNQMVEKEGGDIDKATSRFMKAYESRKDNDVLDTLADLGGAGIDTVGETLDFGYEILKRPKALGRTVAEQIALSAPALVGGAGGAVAGGATGAAAGFYGGMVLGPAGTILAVPGSVAGAVAGGSAGTFAGSAAVEFGSWINQSLQERGYDTSDPNQLIAAYKNKKLMAEIQGEAKRKAIATASVEAMFSAFGGVIAKKAVGATAAKRVGEFAKGVAVESVGETAGELAGQVAAYEGDFRKISVGESVLEGFTSLGQSVGQTAISTSVAQVAEAGKKIKTKIENPVSKFEDVITAGEKAQQALNEIDAVRELGEIANDSNLQTRSPESFADLIDSHSPDNAVYFQKDEWDNYWQSKGESPVAKAEELLGSSDSYLNSQSDGMPIEVPIKDYASKLGGKPEYSELLEIARTQPDGQTAREAAEYLKSLPAEIKKISEEAVQYKKQLEEEEAGIKAVKENIESQLKAAGRDKIEATIITEFYRVMGKRLGITTDDMAKKYGLDIKAVDEGKTVDGEGVLNQDERGRIRIKGNNKFTIELLKTADKSTFFHESGHYFLEILKDVNSMESANQEIKDDFKSIMDWLGVNSPEDITTEHHEKWARGFEAYLREGKAPSNKLRKAFNTFKVWLTSVYKRVSQLNVELSDDVRGVMDRMLATEQEISEAESRSGFEPLFKDPVGMGMNQKQAESYIESVGKVALEARESFQKNLEKAVERQKSIQKSIDKKAIEKRVNEMPVYNMISILKKGIAADGSKLPDNVIQYKINKTEFDSKYPQHKGDPKFRGMFSKKEPYSLDIIAGNFGYKNSDELVNAIINTPEKNKFIDSEAKRIANEKFKQVEKPESIKADADTALHNISREKRLRMEYEYLASNNKGLSKEITRRVVRRPVPQTEIKKAAQSRIDEMKVNDIKPYTFRLAERRYAKLAGELLVKGDIAGAFDAKQKELFNFELYNESVKAKEFSKKHVKDVKKFFKKDEDLVKTREIDFINAGRAILSRYGLGKTDKEPLQYLSKIKEYNPDAYETISGIVTSIVDNPDDYKNISYGQFVDLIDGLNSLWHLSKDVKEIEIDGKKVQIESAAEELLSQAEVFKKPKKQEKYNRTATDSEKLRKGLLGVKAMLQRFEHWVDVMDLGNVSGPFKKYLYQQVSDASDQYLTERKKYKEKIVKLSEPIRKSMDLTKKIESPELNFEFKNKAELLGALLHVGNESNLKKLLVGREWGALNEDGSVNTSNWDKFLDRMHRNGTLTKADWDYIQALWDLMEDIKPMAQKAHRKVFGFYFNEITSQKVNTPFGEYRGGYAPAAIDPDAVTDIARKAELEEFIKGHNSYTYPAAGGRGFTKNRVENFNKPLNLDIGLVVKHVDDVLRFSIIKPKVVDSAKIIMNQNFKSGIGEIDPVVIEKLIKPALNRADKNTIQNVDPAGSPLVRRLGSMLRANASMQLMFANAVNTAEQVAGFAVASTRISPRALMKAGYRYLHNPGFHANQIKELSTFMNTRTDDQIFEMEKQSQKIFSEESNFEKVRTWSQKHAFFMQAWTQNFMDNIIWSGSYDESLSKGLSEKEAIRKADADIRMTQSSRRPLDVANIETNATLNFFQMFMNFFNTMANLNAANFQKLYYEDMGLKSKFYKGMYLYIMGYASIAVISAAIRKAAAGGLDEDDDGEYIDDLYDVFIGSQIDLGLAMIPAVGPAVNAGINRLNDKVYDDRVSASPAISSISSIVGTTGKLATGQLTDDKGIKGDVRDGITGLGVVTGLPLGGLNRPVGYVIDVNTGKARPKGPLDITRGLITGKPGTR